jgi:hypothetical protein
LNSAEALTAYCEPLLLLKIGRVCAAMLAAKDAIATEIKSPKVSDVQPRLFHYTSEAGLYGIIKENRIWATHFSYVNDSQELLYAKKFLTAAFKDSIRLRFDELIREGKVVIGGGHSLESLAELDASNFVDGLYKVGLKLAVPCITCFCHHDPTSKAYSDGLLSQWRAYGKGGGFALEFLTSGLEDCIKEDASFNSHSGYYPGNVIYGEKATEDDQMKIDFAKIARVPYDLIPNILERRTEPPDLEYSWDPFVRCISRIKDDGFSEEAEVRCVYMVPRGKLPEGRRPAREIRFRDSQRAKVPYVELFGNGSIKLPVKRIIVGPHPRAELRRNSIELFLEQGRFDIEVAQSGIPYVPE